MKNLIFLFLFSCASEVGIIKRYESSNDSGAQSVVDSSNSIETGDIEDTNNNTDSEAQTIEGTVGLVSWELEQVACPACMGVQQEITIGFDADFHEKINDVHPTWVPDQGQCVQSLNYLSINRNSKNLGNAITVSGQYNSFTAYKDSANIYKGTLYESQYDRNSQYTVSFQDGTIFNFNSISGFDFIEPLSLRYVDPSYAFAAPIYRSGSTFWWGPSGSSQTFNITLAVYSQDGSQLLGYASCSGADSGMMTIPGSYLNSFPTWSLVAVHMTRYKHERVPYESLLGYVDVQLYWSVVGTGHIE